MHKIASIIIFVITDPADATGPGASKMEVSAVLAPNNEG